MGIVVDTSVFIAAEKGKFDLEAFAADHGQQNFFISVITAAELLVGVERAAPASRRNKRAAFVEALLTIPTIEYDKAIARRHAAIWASLAAGGNQIGPYDMIIAATALEYGHSLATLNAGEFGRVAKLKLIDLAAYLDS
jgi:tRNA(fMet)-specific endonuclease VapC